MSSSSKSSAAAKRKSGDASYSSLDEDSDGPEYALVGGSENQAVNLDPNRRLTIRSVKLPCIRYVEDPQCT